MDFRLSLGCIYIQDEEIPVSGELGVITFTIFICQISLVSLFFLYKKIYVKRFKSIYEFSLTNSALFHRQLYILAIKFGKSWITVQSIVHNEN